MMDHREVQKRFPGAFEALARQRWEDHFEDYKVSEAVVAFTQTFSVDERGRLWVEDEVPSDPLLWDPERGWLDDIDEVVIPKEGA